MGGLLKLLNKVFSAVAEKKLEAAMLALLTAVGVYWQSVWIWLQGGDGEVAHRAVFILVVAAFLLWRIAPLLPAPFPLVPLEEPGDAAILTVRNQGRDEVFYASLEVLAVKKSPDVSGRFRRASLGPTWDGQPEEMPLRRIKRNQGGDLRLARVRHDPSSTHGRYHEVKLVDHDNKDLSFTGRGNEFTLAIAVKITVTREEKRLFFRALPARSATGYYLIECSPEGLSVHSITARRARRLADPAPSKPS